MKNGERNALRMADVLSRRYLVAGRSVIAERSPDIQGDNDALLQEVNECRRLAGLEPLEDPDVDPWGLNEEGAE